MAKLISFSWSIKFAVEERVTEVAKGYLEENATLVSGRSEDQRPIAVICVSLTATKTAANAVLERGIGPISGNAFLAENDGSNLAIARSGGMAVKCDEGIPKSKGLGAPAARCMPNLGRTSQNPPQCGKLVDGGAEFGDAARNKGQGHRSLEKIRSLDEELQSERSVSEEKVAAFAVVDEKVYGTRQIRHKDCIF